MCFCGFWLASEVVGPEHDGNGHQRPPYKICDIGKLPATAVKQHSLVAYAVCFVPCLLVLSTQVVGPFVTWE